MSRLNIQDLFHTSNLKESRERERFDEVLRMIHQRIINQSKKNITYCTYTVPKFILGTPIYDFKKLLKYLVINLKNNEFDLVYFKPNILLISWENKGNTNNTNNTNTNNTNTNTNNTNTNNTNTNNTNNFKSIDNAVPDISGDFKNAILSINEKSNNFKI